MIREIKIKPVLNGFVCDIGCQTVVFETPAALANAIQEYFIKPGEVEKRYRETALNRALLVASPAPTATGSSGAMIRSTVYTFPEPATSSEVRVDRVDPPSVPSPA